MLKQLSIFIALTLPLKVFAETHEKNPIPPGSIIAAESMTKMITGLILVLVIIIAIAWLLKRFAIIPTTATGHIKIVAATSVGQRERVVIVEVDETWLVLGVTPGQVNKLHKLDKKPSNTDAQQPKQSSGQFSVELGKSIGKITNQ